MNHSNSKRIAPVFGLAAPIFVIGAACALLVRVESAAPSTARAWTSDEEDFDGDGLSDKQEAILLTSAFLADTDGDGISDTEEIARHMQPLVPNLAAPLGRPKVGVMARGGGMLHLSLAFYLPNTSLTGVDVRLGLRTSRRAGEFGLSDVSGQSTVQILPAAAPQAMLALVEVTLPPQVVPLSGDLAFYATLSVAGSDVVASSTVARLRRIDGEIVYCMPMPERPADAPAYGGGGAGGGGSNPPAGGTIFQPLFMGADPATPWTPGMICHQRATQVGVNGALVTSEVTSSECLSNWETSCPPSCSQAVGTTFDSVDPLALLGG
jgi:hypothetical protein